MQPTQPPDEGIDAQREMAARREVLSMYRHQREAGIVPLVAMADVRRVIADSVCETILSTGAVPQYWMARYRAAIDYTQRLTARPWPLTP